MVYIKGQKYSSRDQVEGEKQFEEKVVQIDRITRVVAGGRRIRFRATVVVGDKAGRVGVAVAKGQEVVLAIQKAVEKAKKNMIEVPLKGTTISHEVMLKYGGAKVFLKPASKGTGIIAGGAVRAVVEAAGIHDILSKMIGSSNKINNVYATFEALRSFGPVEKKKEEKIIKKEIEVVKEKETLSKKEAPKKMEILKETKEVKKEAKSLKEKLQ